MTRTIYCDDALRWLPKQSVKGIVTGLPDAEEIGATIPDWEEWFYRAVSMCFRASTGPVVFCQTDRKFNGGTVSKANIVFRAAAECNARLIWHKIVLRRDVGKVDLHRPGYTHMLAFNGKPGVATPDVINHGKLVYPNALGLDAALVACRWAGSQVNQIADPFCGRGTIPAVVQALGLEAIGVDIDPEQVAHALRLRIDLPMI